jgi:hypothetical protein
LRVVVVVAAIRVTAAGIGAAAEAVGVVTYPPVYLTSIKGRTSRLLSAAQAPLVVQVVTVAQEAIQHLATMLRLAAASVLAPRGLCQITAAVVVRAVAQQAARRLLSVTAVEVRAVKVMVAAIVRSICLVVAVAREAAEPLKYLAEVVAQEQDPIQSAAT